MVDRTPPIAGQPAAENTITVVVRSSSPTRLHFLDEALFSLATQDWKAIEVLVMLQSPTADFSEAVSALAHSFAWPAEAAVRVIPVPVDAGVDGRARLLNAGIAAARGRYLAFLDDDDVVYPKIYSRLIARLNLHPEAALAASGCRMARVEEANGQNYIAKKFSSNFATATSTKFDLFRENFIPVHAYVIDRYRSDPEALRLDEGTPPLEDYAFLLAFAAHHSFDLALVLEPLCEYRLHGKNSLWVDDGMVDRQALTPSPAVRRARRAIEDQRLAARLTMTYEEWHATFAHRPAPPPPEPPWQPPPIAVPPPAVIGLPPSGPSEVEKQMERRLHSLARGTYRTIDRMGPLGRLVYYFLARPAHDHR